LRLAAVRDAGAEWLLASSHPPTRPASLDLTGNPTWRGLQIIDTAAGRSDDDTQHRRSSVFRKRPSAVPKI
jgi:SEC-C motif-containing protein